ncbi:MAG: hypothetical protein HOC33_15685 [Alphaproteobacteria bacterium]|jgi:hypothetical protein|nr:hypothetical protein [Alphaproteobacteria bacterium]MBT4086650.1 hypothetical protein [Alphaproteobacteria bacterium]MBT4545295.1 hypothetical protein [Alphaproteobacteria bacterium]
MVNKFVKGIQSLLVIGLLSACAANQTEVPASVKTNTEKPSDKAPESETKPETKPVTKPAKKPAARITFLNERHSGYYYPVPGSGEIYKARSEKLDRANRVTRLGFVTGITKQQQERSYPPRFAIFAKGDGAQKLIIIGLDEGTFSSLFRARAALAQMTAMARLTPLFKQLGVQDYFTFFDLTKLLGFKDITVSDGVTWSHRIQIR